ncbi:hypothetical protein [Winogradskyella aurantiaca]|uniref:hypothetical protein n=1 Tax=Winogradskyella aurantiaca TaxID=2219558 RepID=UPI000E1DE774|nr:hypothetical protein [Winogradskyella aurantiaca]
MHSNLRITLLTLASLLIVVFTAHSQQIGHIYKVDLEIAEDLQRRQIDHYSRNGKPVYKGETDFELYSLDEVESIVKEFAAILAEHSETSEVTHEPAKESLNNMFGNFGSNALGKSKMRYFPKNKLKKIKTKADIYYEIDFDFKYGGGKSRGIAMNKVSSVSSIKFSAKVKVTAYNAKRKEIWEKTKTITDFSEAFDPTDMPFSSSEKWFELYRAPVLSNGLKEKEGDIPAKDVSKDEYWQLSLAEIEACMNIALAKSIE